MNLLSRIKMIKATRGPCTNSGEAYDIMNCELDEKDIGCFYLEVQFTRDTALLIPKTSYIIIRLLKDYSKKLPVITGGVLTI